MQVDAALGGELPQVAGPVLVAGAHSPERADLQPRARQRADDIVVALARVNETEDPHRAGFRFVAGLDRGHGQRNDFDGGVEEGGLVPRIAGHQVRGLRQPAVGGGAPGEPLRALLRLRDVVQADAEGMPRAPGEHPVDGLVRGGAEEMVGEGDVHGAGRQRAGVPDHGAAGVTGQGERVLGDPVPVRADDQVRDGGAHRSSPSSSMRSAWRAMPASTTPGWRR